MTESRRIPTSPALEREQAATLAQITDELAKLNKTMLLIAESLRAITARMN